MLVFLQRLIDYYAKVMVQSYKQINCPIVVRITSRVGTQIFMIFCKQNSESVSSASDLFFEIYSG